MAEAKNGDNVKVHYTGRLADETVFDSSDGREPLAFTVGAGQVIPGFDDAVVGMQTGETKTVVIPMDDAYGPRQDELVLEVDRKQLPADIAPEVGDQYQLRQPDGQAVLVTVADVTPTHVTLDANHPLAGQDLTFDIHLVEIE